MMATESNMNIIDTKDEGIVVKEIPISISDEKLRNSLSRAYEEAQKDITNSRHYFRLLASSPHLNNLHFLFRSSKSKLSSLIIPVLSVEDFSSAIFCCDPVFNIGNLFIAHWIGITDFLCQLRQR